MSDKWTGRRGSQGDDWMWEGSAPANDADSIHLEQPEKPLFAEESARRPLRPQLPRPALPHVRFAWPAFALPTPFLALRKLTRSIRESLDRPSDRSQESPDTTGGDFTRFAAILAVFSLIAALALVAVLIASLIGDGDDDSDQGPGESPRPTEATESPTETAGATETPATQDETPGVLVPPPPSGDISLGFWANSQASWWFSDLPAGAAEYHPGDEPPFILRWTAEAEKAYTVEITYECASGGTPAIDRLTGVEFASEEIFLAEWGPGTTFPEAAVPIPATVGVDTGEAGPGLLYLYGGDFVLLPGGPSPDGPCDGERTITVPVRAHSSEMILMGSVWLAHPDDHDGSGASDAKDTIALQATVEGVGTVAIGLKPGVISP